MHTYGPQGSTPRYTSCALLLKYLTASSWALLSTPTAPAASAKAAASSDIRRAAARCVRAVASVCSLYDAHTADQGLGGGPPPPAGGEPDVADACAAAAPEDPAPPPPAGADMDLASLIRFLPKASSSCALGRDSNGPIKKP